MSRTDGHRKSPTAPRAPLARPAHAYAPPRSDPAEDDPEVEAADADDDWTDDDWRALDDEPELDDDLAQQALAARGDDDE
jgi:hypothetical protein